MKHNVANGLKSRDENCYGDITKWQSFLQSFVLKWLGHVE